MDTLWPMMDHNPEVKPAIGGHKKVAVVQPAAPTNATGGGGGGGAGAGAGAVTGKAKKSFFRKKLPARLFSHVEDREEFRILDYMPCTNRQPIDLHDPLRVRRSGRKIKIFLNITYYNEHADELRASLRGAAEQLDQLTPAVSWEEMAVSIVCDGRAKMHKSMLEYCQNELKLFDPDLLRLEHKGNEVTCHVFEKSVELSKHAAQREYYQPLQLILAIKERNGGKLNSHLWYFSGFCRQLQPDYCFLLDVGTQPNAYAFAKLYNAMESNPQIGGCCGEITVRDPKVYNLVEASQHFEYKISHVMDKAMESVFGYISVLPGAFSAYRWVAIRGEPLNQYFYVEEHSVKQMGPFMANMYLAEDRVLCFELLSKKERNWTMHFVTGATASTDVPGSLLDLIKQRRRWLNGSFFSLVYYITKFTLVLQRSDHGLWRRLALSIQFVYMLGLLCLGWLSVGSLYLSLVIIFSMAFEQIPDVADELMYGFQLLYTFITFLQLICGLGSKPQNVQRIYFVSSMLYGVTMLVALFFSAWHLAAGRFSTTILVASGGAFASYAVSAAIHGELMTTVAVFFQYMFMLPTYVNMFTIFSFCNMHDISWGTKEGNLTYEKARMKDPKTNNVMNLVEKLKGPGAKAAQEAAGLSSGMSAADLLKLNALAGAQGADESELEEIRRTAIAFTEAAQKAIDDRAKAEIEKRTMELKKQEKEMAAEFESFRTRLLSLWMFTNWMYATVVTAFNLIEFYAFLIAALIAFTLIFRVTGSVIYQLERLFKACWELLCGWCCCTPFWVHDPSSKKNRKRNDRWANRRGGRGGDSGEYDTDDSDYDSGEDRWRDDDFDDEYDEYSEGSYSDSEAGRGAGGRRDSLEGSEDTIELEERQGRGRGSHSRSRSRGGRSRHSRTRSTRKGGSYSSGGSSSEGSSEGSASDSESSGYSSEESRHTRRSHRSRGGRRSKKKPSRSRQQQPALPGSAPGAVVVERKHMIDLSKDIDHAVAASDRVARHSGAGRGSPMVADIDDDDVDEIITVETSRRVPRTKQGESKREM